MTYTVISIIIGIIGWCAGWMAIVIDVLGAGSTDGKGGAITTPLSNTLAGEA